MRALLLLLLLGLEQLFEDYLALHGVKDSLEFLSVLFGDYSRDLSPWTLSFDHEIEGRALLLRLLHLLNTVCLALLRHRLLVFVGFGIH